MEVSKDPTELILCRWAEAKYGLTNVVSVAFEPDAHGPYSDVTPDVDPYVEVCVYVKGEKRPRIFEWEPYHSRLINEIVRFTLDQSKESS